MANKVTTIRMEPEFRDCIDDLIQFYNRHLLVKGIAKQDFIMLFIRRGMVYYYELACRVCKKGKERKRLERLRADFDAFRMQRIKNRGPVRKMAYSMYIDEKLYSIMERYVRIENGIWEREWSLLSLLAGSIINGWQFYIQHDRELFKTRIHSLPEEYTGYTEYEEVIGAIEKRLGELPDPEPVFLDMLNEG